MEHIRLKFYKASHFGFYSRRATTPRLYDMEFTFREFSGWVANKRVKATVAARQSEGGEFEKIFCAACKRDEENGDYLIVLWMGIDTGDGNSVGAIPSDANTNDEGTNLQENEFDPGSIPGYPLYFYVIPSQNVICPIKIGKNQCSMVPFKKYFLGYLANVSSMCNYVVNQDGDRVCVSYGRNPEQIEAQYHPKFEYSYWIRNDDRAFISDNRLSISKVIKSEVMVRESARDLMSRVLGTGNVANRRTIERESVKFKFEIDMIPSEEELREMLESYDHARGEFGDLKYGFKIGATIYWLEHSIQRFKYDAEVGKVNSIVYNLDDLIASLRDHRTEIIASIQ
jgi:hypothetical protein